MTSSSDSPGCPSRGRGPVGPLLQRQQSFPMLKLPPVCTFYGALNCHWVAPGTTINAFSDAEYLVGRPRLCQMDWVSSLPFPSTPLPRSLPPQRFFFPGAVASRKQPKLVYLLGADDVPQSEIPADAFVIYQVRASEGERDGWGGGLGGGGNMGQCD